MLQLDNVTLLGIDCVEIERLIFAAEVSMKNIQFKAVKLLTHLQSDHEAIVKIPPITSIEAYSHFMFKELVHYVDTDYVLIIQHDGYVLNPAQWHDTFFEFDYIGAPCIWGMGNGGFSFRSKKLLEILASEDAITQLHPEDFAICKTYRPFLENKGIRFATSEIAYKFSVESNIWEEQFGFHNADIAAWNIDEFACSTKHKFFIEKFKKKYKYSQIKLTYIVQFYLKSNVINPVNELIAIYSRYDAAILDKIHFVFVDDGSPIPVEIDTDINLHYTLLRIEDDIPWNQGGARNLGVEHAKSERLLLTDLDIIFPENLLSQLLYFYPPQHSIFKFKTVSNLKVIEPHFNVFLMWKDTFLKTKGVDEEFSGRYGHDDVFFYFLNKALGVKFYLFKYSNIILREHKEQIPTQHNPLKRDITENKILFEKKMEIVKNAVDPMEARSDLYLNFNWKVIEEKVRK